SRQPCRVRCRQSLPCMVLDRACIRPQGRPASCPRRSRRYEARRPGLADLVPLVERALPGPFFRCAIWSDLAACTETAYARRALEGTWPPPLRTAMAEYTLVCRSNLDLYWGAARTVSPPEWPAASAGRAGGIPGGAGGYGGEGDAGRARGRAHRACQICGVCGGA